MSTTLLVGNYAFQQPLYLLALRSIVSKHRVGASCFIGFRPFNCESDGRAGILYFLVSALSGPSSNKLNDATGIFDLLFSFGADVTRLDDDWDVNAALAQQFCVAMIEEIDNRGGLGSRRRTQVLFTVFFGNERKELVNVHNGLPLVVALQMEVAHSYFSEVTRMVFVQVGSVVVLTSGKTATTGMLAMFSNASMSGADMTPVFPGFAQMSRHVDKVCGVCGDVG